LQTDETRYSLALKSIHGVGIVGANKLLAHFKSARAIFEASPDALAHAKLKPEVIRQITQFDPASLDSIIAWGQADNRHIIPLHSPYYPPLLAQIHHPPLLLFAIGNPELLLSPQIAVVGSRSPTPQGLANTQMLCQALAHEGITVTSGLALGIDGEAHRAALASQGFTIAVTGTGLNRVYPAIHRELAHQIAQSGVLVSESFPDEGHQQGSFPQRNRIIAGLSLGTLVIEAAQKSGTLITARHSLDEGREVYAVPGSIHSPLSKGCHQLIKQGAKLVESIEDIMEDLPHLDRALVNRAHSDNKQPLDSETAEFLKHIDYEVTSVDTIVMRSQLTVEAVTNKLLSLELEGWVINSVGGYIRQ